MIVTDVVRLLAHSSSDDQTKYRSKEELERDRQRDPIIRMKDALIDAGMLTQEEFEQMEKDVLDEVNDVTDIAEAKPLPDPSTALQYLYSPKELGLRYEHNTPSGNKTVIVDASYNFV